MSNFGSLFEILAVFPDPLPAPWLLIARLKIRARAIFLSAPHVYDTMLAIQLENQKRNIVVDGGGHPKYPQI